MIKKIIAVACCAATLFTSAIPALAAETSNSVKVNEKDITTEQTFTVNSVDNLHYDFEEQIIKDGKKYNLKGVNYNIISTEDIRENQTITHKVDYNNLYSKNANAPETLKIMQNGEEIEVKLTGVDYTETTITGRSERVTAYTDFDYKTVKPDAPKTKIVTYYDDVTKRNVTATLNLKELKAEKDWAWRNDVTIPMTFSFYDSEYYVLGDKYVPYNDEKPGLEGFENDLLNELNLDTYKYRINSVEWVGDKYTLGDMTYRKAVAHGERYVANYIAYYESNVNLPNAKGYNAVANYEAERSVLTGEKEYTVSAEAVYSPDNTTALAIAGTVGGLILIVLLVIAILYVISKKKERKGEA